MTLRPADLTMEVWIRGDGYREVTVHLEPTPDGSIPYRAKSCYDVSYGGDRIGRVWRREFTRERRTPGKRYVNARWSSYGWTYGNGAFEAYPSTRNKALERLIAEHLEEADE